MRVRRTLAVLALAPAAGLGACGGGDGGGSAGVAVQAVPPGYAAIGAGAAAAEGQAYGLTASPATAPGRRAAWARPGSPAVRVESDRPPVGDLRLAFPLRERPRRGQVPVALVAERPGGPLQARQATVDGDGRYATFQAPRVDLARVDLVDLAALARTAARTAEADAAATANRAERPRCDDEDEARADGFTVRGDAAPAWCFGREGDTRVLRVANLGRRPVVLDHAGAELRSATGAASPALRDGLRDFDDELTVLAPGGRAMLEITEPVRVRSTSGGLAARARVLGAGAEVAAELLAPAARERRALRERITTALLRDAACVGAMGRARDAADLLERCFTADALADDLGAAGEVAARVVSDPVVARALRGQDDDRRTVIAVRREDGPVLGRTDFVPGGRGWGRIAPEEIFNGGRPVGRVEALRWTGWGRDTARGTGRTTIYRPGGGYYAEKVVAEFEATRLDTCAGRAERAYTRLRVRTPVRPGGPPGPWRLWALDLCDASATAQACADATGTTDPGGDTGARATDVTVWDGDCATAERLAERIPERATSEGGARRTREEDDGFTCASTPVDGDGSAVRWVCLRGTSQITFQQR